MRSYFRNKYILSYLGAWGGLLILSSLTGETMEFQSLVLYTGILALVGPALCWVIQRRETPKGKCYTVYRMDDPKPVCRVEGENIYPGTDENPKWYYRKGKVHAFADKPNVYLYRVEDNLIYRSGEEQPCMLIREDTVYAYPDNIPLYQTVE